MKYCEKIDLTNPDFSACVSCPEKCGPKDPWNDCFNCRFRDPLKMGPGDKRCGRCNKVHMMRAGAGVLTPTLWVWDEGDKSIDDVRHYIFKFHSSPAYKKKLFVEPLRLALESLKKKRPDLFTDEC